MNGIYAYLKPAIQLFGLGLLMTLSSGVAMAQSDWLWTTDECLQDDFGNNIGFSCEMEGGSTLHTYAHVMSHAQAIDLVEMLATVYSQALIGEMTDAMITESAARVTQGGMVYDCVFQEWIDPNEEEPGGDGQTGDYCDVSSLWARWGL
jgi:hypothetical protein